LTLLPWLGIVIPAKAGILGLCASAALAQLAGGISARQNQPDLNAYGFRRSNEWRNMWPVGFETRLTRAVSGCFVSSCVSGIFLPVFVTCSTATWATAVWSNIREALDGPGTVAWRKSAV